MNKTLLKNIYIQNLSLLLIVIVGTLLLTLSAKIKVPFNSGRGDSSQTETDIKSFKWLDLFLYPLTSFKL